MSTSVCWNTCDGKQLAAWMRQTCLDEKRQPEPGKLPRSRRHCFVQLAGIGELTLTRLPGRLTAVAAAGTTADAGCRHADGHRCRLERLRHAVLKRGQTMIVKVSPPGARRWRRACGLPAGQRPPARRCQRSAGEAGGSPGAYRRLALRRKIHIRRRVLWVEHRDKGRLELNFLIPNTELLTGRRLQPYYDRADRPRIDAWQTIVNGRLGLHDPNAPENRRALVTPSALPETKQEAAQAITRGLLALARPGS